MHRTSGMSPAQLTGRSHAHVVAVPGSHCLLHRDSLASFLSLQAAATAAGFRLAPVSGFRDFERQLAIWNGKCSGERALLDRDSRPLVVQDMDDEAVVLAILGWSALPGASRHHWGSEVDVIDAASWPAGEPGCLEPAHYARGGAFAGLSSWLDRHAADHGFYRPYATDRGGVQPEPWHLSHAAVSWPAQQALTLDVLEQALAGVPIAHAGVIGRLLPHIHERYVANVDPPPPALPAAVGVGVSVPGSTPS